MRNARKLSLRGDIVRLPPNRVWRSYLGGATLDQIDGKPTPSDSHLAEDWIGSTTLARNPVQAHPDEGISTALVGNKEHNFRDLIASDPNYFLGARHVAKHGQSLLLLVKFLDPSIRLHFQCHPTREFAQKHLNSPSGKTEAYHILDVREDVAEPFIYVGFQRPPSAKQMRTWIEKQNIAALEACFEKIPVRRGDTFFIPGGLPHALGPGVFMIEIQEPTDFVSRYEFERGGYVLPEAARFMGRDVDFGLSMINFNAFSVADIRMRFQCSAGERDVLGEGSWRAPLIDSDRTSCFRVSRARIVGTATLHDATFSINVVTSGQLNIHVNGHTHTLRRHDKFFCPAGLGALELHSEGPTEILQCFPPV